jgi:O-antigen/teichoic acid export membrane protein
MRGAFILVLLIGATVLYDYQSIIVSVLGAVDRPDLGFRVNGVLVLSNVVLNVVLIYYYGWTGAAVATLTSAALSLCLGYYLLRTLLEIDPPIQQVGGQVFSAVVMAAVVYAAEYVLVALGVDPMRALPTLAMVALGAGTYGVSLLAVSPRFRETLSDNLTPLLDRLGAAP